MPRKSAAAASTLALVPGTPAPAPPDLSKKEAAVWCEVVESKPWDWFGRDSLPVLKEYVRAAVMCDALAEKVSAGVDGEANVLRALLGMRDQEARRVATLVTKLRLTQQSRYTPQSANAASKKAGAQRPWQK